MLACATPDSPLAAGQMILSCLRGINYSARRESKKEETMRPAALCAVAVALAISPLAGGGSAAAGPLPSRIGQCTRTAISRIGQRLEDGSTGRPIPGSGSAVSFANGGSQVSYEEVPQILRSRRGDPVRICLVSLPKNCPPGDDRGRVYRTTNLRTHQSWTLPDSEHMCGGA
jgi:hypothetical protein